MKAVAVFPGKPYSAHLTELPKPSASDIPNGRGVLIEVLRVGIDGTDNEINEGLYGEAPAGSDSLVIGHEGLGRVEEVGGKVSGFSVGDLVVATVRRPGGCINCQAGESDMCLDGIYTERGIKGAHGYMAEFYADTAEFLVKIPAEHEAVAVMLEPLTVVEKAVFQAFKMQERMVWRPERALVTGAGTIGLLGALLLRGLHDMEVHVISREPHGSFRAEWLKSIGAVYHTTDEVEIVEAEKAFGRIDLIVEATGVPQVIFAAMCTIGRNGILALLGISGGNREITVPGGQINLELVLGNETIFGSVNANRRYFEMGVEHFAVFERKWPGAMQKLITRRVPFDDYRSALERRKEDIKTVLELEAPNK
jgi:threonine dehydrogenase-like Zn-dependent dehydrogenase